MLLLLLHLFALLLDQSESVLSVVDLHWELETAAEILLKMLLIWFHLGVNCPFYIIANFTPFWIWNKRQNLVNILTPAVLLKSFIQDFLRIHGSKDGDSFIVIKWKWGHSGKKFYFMLRCQQIRLFSLTQTFLDLSVTIVLWLTAVTTRDYLLDFAWHMTIAYNWKLNSQPCHWTSHQE